MAQFADRTMSCNHKIIIAEDHGIVLLQMGNATTLRTFPIVMLGDYGIKRSALRKTVVSGSHSTTTLKHHALVNL
jgi:hypothetical protein